MNVLKKIFVIGVGIWGMATVAIAQTDRQLIREGNRHYFKQEYAKAETAYRKALSQNNANAQAAYNLGCALQMQQKDSAAIEQYQQAGKMESIKKRKAKAYHNIGVICQGHQMFAEAIEAYKESLRNNPADNETRYNLALCMRQQKNQQNGNDKKQQDKDKEKKDDNKKQQDKEKQQQNKEDQKQPPAKENMSKENAEQLLNAAMQEEKATQQRLKKAAQQPPKRNLQKNW